jgi:hypothetical protein
MDVEFDPSSVRKLSIEDMPLPEPPRPTPKRRQLTEEEVQQEAARAAEKQKRCVVICP